MWCYYWNEYSILFRIFYTVQSTQCSLLCQSKAHRNILTYLCVIRNLLSHIDIIILWSQMGACSPIFQLLFIYLFWSQFIIFCKCNRLGIDIREIFANVNSNYNLLKLYERQMCKHKCVRKCNGKNYIRKTFCTRFMPKQNEEKTKLFLKHMIECTDIEEHRRTAVVTHFQNCMFFSSIWNSTFNSIKFATIAIMWLRSFKPIIYSECNVKPWVCVLCMHVPICVHKTTQTRRCNFSSLH